MPTEKADFVSLRELSAIMSDTLCEEVFRKVISGRQSLNSTTRSRLQSALRAGIQLSGFRDANNAPEKLLFQHAVCAFRQHSTELMAALLQSWIELEREFAELLCAYLTQRGITAAVPERYPRFFLGPLTVKDLTEFVSAFCETNGERDSEATLLMMFCLTKWCPSDSDNEVKEARHPLSTDTRLQEVDILSLIERDLQVLEAQTEVLASKLSEAFTSINTVGKIPDAQLANAIQALCNDANGIKARILDLAFKNNLDLRLPNVIEYISELRRAFEALKEAGAKRKSEEEIRTRALQILEKIQALAHRDRRDFDQLQDCQARARTLHLVLTERWDAESESDAKLLAAGSHPLAQLLLLIESSNELTDDQWQQANETIAKELGQALAIAVARGKLFVSSSSDADGEKITATPNTSHGSEDASFIEDRPIQRASETPPSAAGRDENGEITNDDGATAIIAVNDLDRAGFEHAEKALHNEKPRLTHQRDDLKSDAIDETATYVSNAQESLLRIVWVLLGDERAGLSYHLAQQLHEAESQQAVPPSWLVRCVALSTHILLPTGEIAETLKFDFRNFTDGVFDPRNAEWNQAIRFLLAAAALRPALIAPSTGAAAILHSLRFKEGVSALYQYCQATATYADSGQPLDPNAVKRVKTQAGWQANVESLQREVNAWCTQAPMMTLVFAPANRVWRKWQEPGGLIHSLLLPVRTNDIARRDTVKELAGRLGDEVSIKREVDATDRKTLHRRRGEDISAKALGQLLKHTRDAVGFARQWLLLHDSSPRRELGYYQQQVQDLAERMGQLHTNVITELDDICRKSASSSVIAAAKCCRRAVENLANLFDPDAALPSTEPLVNEVINFELLFTNVHMDLTWGLDATGPELVEEVKRLFSRGDVSWKEAFDARATVRDHDGTALIIEHLYKKNGDDRLINDFRELREKRLQECREALRRDVNETRGAIDKAVTFGLLKESELTALMARLEKVELALESVARFGPAHHELETIRNEISSKREARVTEVRARLAVSKLPAAVSDRVLSVLATGDVLSANEYIDIARSGRSLPPTNAEPDTFEQFFPDMYRTIEAFLEPQDRNRPEPSVLVSRLREMARGSGRGNSIGPVTLNAVAGKQLEQCADMLEGWFTTKRSHRGEPEVIRRILIGLGFGHATSVAPDTSIRRAWFKVSCDPIRDRDRCPAAVFGSGAQGRYRLLCVWDRPTEEDLITEVSDTTHTAPAIVFYFGRMSEKVRRDLAQRCRRRRRTFIVVDDVLILFLCGERGSRMSSMFRCALPFTFLEPYAATAGLVSPEMFYGRSAERNEIMERMGSCYIYGGRQLGKTALLRDVEQTFHRPEDGRIALWIDLKTFGIGFDQPIEEFWFRLGQELKQLSLVPSNMPPHASADTIINHVQTWLSQGTDRRVLLLLDEADRFLDQDSKHDFVHTARLKGAMDRTNRRFKVVLAGLHNVQRTTRLENNPLAHYGEPICIGPLLEDGEWKEAWQLVEQPFASIGYRFGSPDLITRILSQTNYYPSLIQLYCNQLLRHMMSRPVETSNPPYIISSGDVEEAYQSRELRKAIRDRFTWTLDLDPRYRLIAFCLALYSSEEPDQADRGFSIGWIRDQVLTFWPKGFADIQSEDTFRILLDEMVGLGVLRATQDAQYALRSLSVISLLGAKEEIEAELESFYDREPPRPYEAATFRSALGTTDGPHDSALRNPLTAAQQSELRARVNGVSIICGCSASGIDNLERFLAAAFVDGFFDTFDAIGEFSEFARRLNAIDNRSPDAVKLLLVRPSCAWTVSWVQEGLRRLTKLTSKRSYVRLVFVADPLATWRLVSELETLRKAGVSIVSLTPWHDSALQHWLDEAGFANVSPADRGRITNVTGNWPLLQQVFHQRCRGMLHMWRNALDQLESDIANRQLPELDMERSFGIERAETRLLLKDLAILQEASTDELLALNSEIPSDIADQVMKWGALLSIVQPIGNERFRIDPLLARLISR